MRQIKLSPVDLPAISRQRSIKNQIFEIKSMQASRYKRERDDTKLAAFSDSLRERIQNTSRDLQPQKLDELMIEAFALVREVAHRKLNMEHRDNQIRGAIELFRGKFIEMNNGEGKTLTSTMPIYLHALMGRGVHVATYNDYLVRRDATWMGKIYGFLGLSVGVLQGNLQALKLEHQGNDVYRLVSCTRREAYLCDVTYGGYQEFVFDYLFDHTSITQPEQIVQRGFYYTLLDEADSVLIDKANEEVAVAKRIPTDHNFYAHTFAIASQLVPNEDFVVVGRDCKVTDAGLAKAEQIANVSSLFAREQAGVLYQIEQSLNAIYIQQRDRDYFVSDQKIFGINSETGRRFWWDSSYNGVAEAIHLKENCPLVFQQRQTTNQTSYQEFYRMYPVLAGMSATVVWRRAELRDVYGRDVIQIKSKKTRVDLEDLIYISREAADRNTVRYIINEYQDGVPQPILVDAITLDRAEKVSAALTEANIPHNLLTAKNDEDEAEIIAQAGEVGSVTITARMAGRGTDIVLSPEAIDLGGLLVIGMERLEERHRNMQLEGRAGRQGKPGTSQFIMSLQDPLWRRLGGDFTRRWMQLAAANEDEAIAAALVSDSITIAQARIERWNAQSRERVYQYDSVLHRQRQYIFDVRDAVLRSTDLKQDIDVIIENFVRRIAQKYLLDEKPEQSSSERFDHFVNAVYEVCPSLTSDLFGDFEQEAPDRVISFTLTLLREALEKTIGETLSMPYAQILIRQVFLGSIDSAWMTHLQLSVQQRRMAGLRSNPLDWYSMECNRGFSERLGEIERNVLSHVFSAQLITVGELDWS